MDYMRVIGTRGALFIDATLLNEEWAQNNHGQTLQRLNERGGLSLCEAAAIAQRREWQKQDAETSIEQLKKVAERKGRL